MKYFIANWKTNKTLEETLQWIDIFTKNWKNDPNRMIIIATSYPFIIPLKQKTTNFSNIKISTQDISMFGKGSFTGEVAAEELAGIIDYAIIGHSERRERFHEDNEMLFKKAANALKFGIIPIFCIRDDNDPIPEEVTIVAYEPVYAIGTGKNEEVDKVLEMKEKIKLPAKAIFLYGGSIDPRNILSYISSPEINGFLVGGSSLDPIGFQKICQS